MLPLTLSGQQGIVKGLSPRHRAVRRLEYYLEDGEVLFRVMPDDAKNPESGYDIRINADDPQLSKLVLELARFLMESK